MLRLDSSCSVFIFELWNEAADRSWRYRKWWAHEFVLFNRYKNFNDLHIFVKFEKIKNLRQFGLQHVIKPLFDKTLFSGALRRLTLSYSKNLVSLFVHLWGGEGCESMFEKPQLAKISHLLTVSNGRNQRLLLKTLRKGVQVHLVAAAIQSESDLGAQIRKISEKSQKELQTIASEILTLIST